MYPTVTDSSDLAAFSNRFGLLGVGVGGRRAILNSERYKLAGELMLGNRHETIRKELKLLNRYTKNNNLYITMKIHIRFPKLNGKSYGQAAHQNELKLIKTVDRLVDDEKTQRVVKPKLKKEYPVVRGGTVKKQPKTFKLE